MRESEEKCSDCVGEPSHIKLSKNPIGLSLECVLRMRNKISQAQEHVSVDHINHQPIHSSTLSIVPDCKSSSDNRINKYEPSLLVPSSVHPNQPKITILLWDFLSGYLGVERVNEGDQPHFVISSGLIFEYKDELCK